MHPEDGSVSEKAAEPIIDPATGFKLSRPPRQGDWMPGHGGIMAPVWKKGQSGNRKGRPSRSSILAPFLEQLAKDCEGLPQGKIARKIAEDLTQAILDGDHKKARMILDIMERTDGPIEKVLAVKPVNAPPVLVMGATAEEALKLAEGFGGPGDGEEEDEADGGS